MYQLCSIKKSHTSKQNCAQCLSQPLQSSLKNSEKLYFDREFEKNRSDLKKKTWDLKKLAIYMITISEIVDD